MVAKKIGVGFGRPKIAKTSGFLVHQRFNDEFLDVMRKGELFGHSDFTQFDLTQNKLSIRLDHSTLF